MRVRKKKVEIAHFVERQNCFFVEVKISCFENRIKDVREVLKWLDDEGEVLDALKVRKKDFAKNLGELVQ